MFSPSMMERFVHKIDEKTRNIFASNRKKQLNNSDFTIISNNCWGGIAYEYYGIPKLSPTVGTYFFADDYIKFITNLQYYLSKPIIFITAEESKYRDTLYERGEKDIPIGVLGDVEIVFLHYKSIDIARDKWNRRIRRVNYNNLVAKFSRMNSCNDEHLKIFDQIDIKKKFMFVNNNDKKYNCAIYYPGFEENEQIENDTFYWNKYFNVTAFLNGNGIIEYNL